MSCFCLVALVNRMLMKQTRRNVTTIRVAKQLYRYVLFRRKQQQKNKTATSDCESDCVHGNCEKAGGECVCSPDQWRPGHKTRYWQNLSYVGEHCDQSKVFCVLCFSGNSTFFFFFFRIGVFTKLSRKMYSTQLRLRIRICWCRLFNR